MLLGCWEERGGAKYICRALIGLVLGGSECMELGRESVDAVNVS